MDKQEVEKWVQKIQELRKNPEEAHSEEDDLYEAFIKHVAATAQQAELAEMAKLVLSTNEIEFARWCA